MTLGSVPVICVRDVGSSNRPRINSSSKVPCESRDCSQFTLHGTVLALAQLPGILEECAHERPRAVREERQSIAVT